MRLKFSQITLVAVLLGISLLGTPTSASAVPTTQDGANPSLSGVSPQLVTATCPGSTMCLWDDKNYGGDLIFKQKAIGLYGTGFFNNDDASSGWNKTLYSAWLYFDANGGGSKYCLPSGYAHSNFSNVPGLNDEISSVEIKNSNCPSGSATIGSFKGY